MFDFFARHRLPQMTSTGCRFPHVHPGVSSRCFWLAIDAQIHPLLLSPRADACDSGACRFVGTTRTSRGCGSTCANPQDGKPIKVKIDDVELANPGRKTRTPAQSRRRHLEAAPRPPVGMKSAAARTGPFKLAFRNHMIFFTGTKGAAERTCGVP